MKYLYALAEINVPPPMTKELSVEELEILIGGIDQAIKQAKEARK